MIPALFCCSIVPPGSQAADATKSGINRMPSEDTTRDLLINFCKYIVL